MKLQYSLAVIAILIIKLLLGHHSYLTQLIKG
jgi:hypothetical protein